MKCTWEKRFGRVMGNFGISFLTPLIGINISNSFVGDHSEFTLTILQALFSASIYTGMSVSVEVKDWSNAK